jgi:hypothetical protein
MGHFVLYHCITVTITSLNAGVYTIKIGSTTYYEEYPSVDFQKQSSLDQLKQEHRAIKKDSDHKDAATNLWPNP